MRPNGYPKAPSVILLAIGLGLGLGCEAAAPALDGGDGVDGAVGLDGAGRHDGADRPDGSGDATPRGDATPVADASPVDAGSACPALVRPTTPDEWSGVEDLADRALIAALLGRIANESLSYDEAKDALFNASDGIEVHGGRVECVYTGLTYAPSQLDESGGYNTEHSWPQSDFPGSPDGTPKSDLHHLFGSDAVVNSRRGSLPFGDTDCSGGCTWEGYDCQIGPRVGGMERVFEVRPAKRGEIARAHFYFSVRYATAIGAAEEATLRGWNRCDPPDDAERTRNDGVEAAQGNRNPFIDRPEFVDQIADF